MVKLREKPFLTPNDKGLMGADDVVSIQNAIDAASKAGINKVVIPRYNKRTDSMVWTISATIRVPANMHLVLDNCYLHRGEGFAGQMLTNSLSRCEEGKLLAGEQTNIRIVGEGDAVIDGGSNGCSDDVWDNMLLYFHNIRQFTVEGLRIVNQSGWGVCFMYCSYGKVCNIDFDAKAEASACSGIMLRCGCHEMTVENITGYTGGDVVALAAVVGKELEQPSHVMGYAIDVRNIIIKNIKATTRGGSNIVSLFNQDGAILYNILVENVSDISAGYTEVRPFCAVRIGGNGETANVRQVLPGETRNITVRNVFTRARYGVVISETLINTLIESLHVHDDSEYAFGVCPVGEKAVVSNLLLKGIYYNVEQKTQDGSAELTPDAYAGEVFSFENCEGKNVRIVDVFADKAARLISATGEITLDVTSAVIDELGDALVNADENAKVTLKNVKVKGEVQK